MPLFYLHISCVFCLFYQLSKTFLMFEMLKPLDDDLSWYSAVYSGNFLIFSSFFLPSFLPPPPLSFFLESNLGHGICQEMILQLNHTSSTQEYRDKKVFPHSTFLHCTHEASLSNTPYIFVSCYVQHFSSAWESKWVNDLFHGVSANIAYVVP